MDINELMPPPNFIFCICIDERCMCENLVPMKPGMEHVILEAPDDYLAPCPSCERGEHTRAHGPVWTKIQKWLDGR
jgi:hypothetical protein